MVKVKNADLFEQQGPISGILGVGEGWLENKQYLEKTRGGGKTHPRKKKKKTRKKTGGGDS